MVQCFGADWLGPIKCGGPGAEIELIFLLLSHVLGAVRAAMAGSPSSIVTPLLLVTGYTVLALSLACQEIVRVKVAPATGGSAALME